MKLTFLIIFSIIIVSICNPLPECDVTVQYIKDIKIQGGSDNQPPEWSQDCSVKVTGDFVQREAIQIFPNCTAKDAYGPQPVTYPTFDIPPRCDRRQWVQHRIQAITDKVNQKQWNYCHHHAPTWLPTGNFVKEFDANKIGSGQPNVGCAGGAKNPSNQNIGLDSAGFIAWIFNYGFGIRITDSLGDQACGPLAPGKTLKLTPRDVDKFLPGDVLYITADEVSKPLNISHAAIWTGIIATDNGPFKIGDLVSNVPDIHKQRVEEDIKYLKDNNIPIYVLADSHQGGPNYRPYAGFYMRQLGFIRRSVLSADTTSLNNPGTQYKAGVCYYSKDENNNNGTPKNTQRRRLKLK
jgi:hypothetical protein